MEKRQHSLESGISDRITVVIVDDEALARERIRFLLNRIESVELVAECHNGAQAVETILRDRPDLVFLDVQMGEMDGFDVIEEIGADRMPVTVFITAFDQYAVEAFRVQALDYLLKPVDVDTFDQTVSLAIKRIHAQRRSDLFSGRMSDLLREVAERSRYASRIPVKDRNGILFVRADDIDWVEASGNYALLHAGKQSPMVRETMARLENQLNPQKFVRIHRSTIVNIERLVRIRPLLGGEQDVELQDGTRLRVGRAFKNNLNRVAFPEQE